MNSSAVAQGCLASQVSAALQEGPLLLGWALSSAQTKMFITTQFAVHIRQMRGKGTLAPDKQFHDAAAYPEFCALHTQPRHQTRWPVPQHAAFVSPVSPPNQ